MSENKERINKILKEIEETKKENAEIDRYSEMAVKKILELTFKDYYATTKIKDNKNVSFHLEDIKETIPKLSIDFEKTSREDLEFLFYTLLMETKRFMGLFGLGELKKIKF